MQKRRPKCTEEFLKMTLTKSSRIMLNTLASYGRSVFALFVGVFSSRWLLHGLGKEDLGLSCVVGSLIGAIVIFETVMQVAVARFYAFAIGKASVMTPDQGKDEVCRWFNVVFFIHLMLPVLIVVFGYPLGRYAVLNWLNIPQNRLEACMFVFNCSMVSTFIGMISTPYVAMYAAKQQIVELSFWGMLRTSLNFCFTFSLMYVTFDRLKYSGAFGAMLALFILSTQMYRARLHFPECRIKFNYFWDKNRLKSIFGYFFWEIFSCTGNMTRQQGSAIVINKCFGSSANAGWQIAQTLSNQATALSNSMTGAFLPAVTSEEGAGEREKMIKLAFRSSKFGTLLIMLFSIPLIVEIDEVLALWLTVPPEYTNRMCQCVLIAFAIDKLCLGHHVAISARGRIGLYHCFVGTTFLLSIPITLFLIWRGVGPTSVGWMFIICYSLVSFERMVFARFLVGMPILYFVQKVVVPLLLTCLCSYIVADCMPTVMSPSFMRVCVSTVVALVVMASMSWLTLFDADEKSYIRNGFVKLNRWRRSFD